MQTWSNSRIPQATIFRSRSAISRSTLESSSACTRMRRSILAPGSASPYAKGLWSGMAGASGWNPTKKIRVPSFVSPCRQAVRNEQYTGLRRLLTVKKSDQDKIVVLLAEDNPADVLIIEEAIELYGLPFELHLARDGGRAFE